MSMSTSTAWSSLYIGKLIVLQLGRQPCSCCRTPQGRLLIRIRLTLARPLPRAAAAAAAVAAAATADAVDEEGAAVEEEGGGGVAAWL